MKRVTIRVPATTANLGPGFDAFGCALSLYTDVTFEETEWGLEITGCEEASPIEKALTSYNYHVYAAYFRYILNNPAVLADSDVWNRMQQDARVTAMPCYPDAGCMQMLDGMLIVKLGDSPLSSEGVLG